MRRALISQQMGINAAGKLAGKPSKGHNAETIGKLASRGNEAISRSASRGHEVVSGLPHPNVIAKQVLPTAEARQRERLEAIKAARKQKESPFYLLEEKEAEDAASAAAAADLEALEREAEARLMFGNNDKPAKGVTSAQPSRGFSTKAGDARVSAGDSRVQQRHAHPKGGKQAAEADEDLVIAGGAVPLEPEGISLGSQEIASYSSDMGIAGALPELGEGDPYWNLSSQRLEQVENARLASRYDYDAENKRDRKSSNQQLPSTLTPEERSRLEELMARHSSEAVPFGEAEVEVSSSSSIRDSLELAEGQRDGDIAGVARLKDEGAYRPFNGERKGNRFQGGIDMPSSSQRRSFHSSRAQAGLVIQRTGAVGKRSLSVKRVDLPGSSAPPGPVEVPEPPSLGPHDPSPPPSGQAPGPSRPERLPQPPAGAGQQGPERAPQPPPGGNPGARTTGGMPFGFAPLERTSQEPASPSQHHASVEELFERIDDRHRRDGAIAKALLYPSNTTIPAGELDYKEKLAPSGMMSAQGGSGSGARGINSGPAADKGQQGVRGGAFYYGFAQTPDTTEGSLFPQAEEGGTMQGTAQSSGKGGVVINPGLGARQAAAILDYYAVEEGSEEAGAAVLPPSVLTASFEEFPEDVGSRKANHPTANGKQGGPSSTLREGKASGATSGPAISSLSDEAEAELEQGLGLKAASFESAPAVLDEEGEGEVENAVPTESLGTREAPAFIEPEQGDSFKRNPFWSGDSAASNVNRMDLMDLTEDRTGTSPAALEKEKQYYRPSTSHVTARAEPRHGHPHLPPPSAYLRGTASGFSDPLEETPVSVSHAGPPAAHPPDDLHSPNPRHRFGVKRSFATKASAKNKKQKQKEQQQQQQAAAVVSKAPAGADTAAAVAADDFFVREEQVMMERQGQRDAKADEFVFTEIEAFRPASASMWDRIEGADPASFGDGGGFGLHTAAVANKRERLGGSNASMPDLASHVGGEQSPSRAFHIGSSFRQGSNKHGQGMGNINPEQLEQAAGTEDQGLGMAQRIHRERRVPSAFPSTTSLTGRGGLGFDPTKGTIQQYKLAAEIAAESLRESAHAVSEEAKAAASEWQVKERAREVLTAAKDIPSAASEGVGTGVGQSLGLVGKISSLAAAVVATVGKALGAGTKVIAASAPSVAKEWSEGYKVMAPLRQAERDLLAIKYPSFVGNAPTAAATSAHAARAREHKVERALRQEVEDAALFESDSIGGAEDEGLSGGQWNYPRLRERASYHGINSQRPSRGFNGIRQVYLQETFGSADVQEEMEMERLAASGRATVEARRGMVAPRLQS